VPKEDRAKNYYFRIVSITLDLLYGADAWNSTWLEIRHIRRTSLGSPAPR
jgi:hypothetical protein